MILFKFTNLYNYSNIGIGAVHDPNASLHVQGGDTIQPPLYESKKGEYP